MTVCFFLDIAFWWHAFKRHGGHLWKGKLVCNHSGYQNTVEDILKVIMNQNVCKHSI